MPTFSFYSKKNPPNIQIKAEALQVKHHKQLIKSVLRWKLITPGNSHRADRMLKLFNVAVSHEESD